MNKTHYFNFIVRLRRYVEDETASLAYGSGGGIPVCGVAA